MAKFSDEERAAILAESFETIERVDETLANGKPALHLPPLETRNQRDRREIEERNARWAEDRMSRARRILVDTTVAKRLEAKCAAMIDQAQAEQKAYVRQLLTELLAAFRDDVMGEVDGSFAEMRKQLAELRKARGADDDNDGPIDLPNPLATRLLQ